MNLRGGRSVNTGVATRQTLNGRASGARVLGAGLLGYAMGSFPTADIVFRYVSRRRGAPPSDLRRVGSGNPGAVNVAKTLGRGWGGLVMAVDMLKGAAAGLLGRALAGDNGAYAAAAASVAGHCYPPWSRFRGGKGVATSFAAELVCFPAYAPLDAAVAVAAFAVSRGRFSVDASPDAQSAGRLGTLVASTAFTLAATYWWRRRLSNLWGPRPTAGLPLYALATAAVVASSFMRRLPRDGAAGEVTAEREGSRMAVRAR